MKEIQKYLTKKNLLIAGGVVVLVIALRQLFKKKPEDASSTTVVTSKTIKNIPTRDNTFVSNITDSQAAQIAKTLFNSMKWAGTNEQAMYDVLKNVNGEGLKLVYKEFGEPKYAAYGYSPYLGTKTDLFGWFQQELDENELSKMKKIWYKSGLML